MKYKVFATGNPEPKIFKPKEYVHVKRTAMKSKKHSASEIENYALAASDKITPIDESEDDENYLESLDELYGVNKYYRMDLPDVLPPYDEAFHSYSKETYDKLSSILLNFNIGGKPVAFGSFCMFLPSPKLKDVLYQDIASVLGCLPDDVLITTGRTVRYLYNWPKIQACRAHAGQFHAAACGWGFNAFDFPELMKSMVHLSLERLHVINLDDMSYRIIEKDNI